MHNQHSGLQHAVAVTQRIHSELNRTSRSKGLKRDAQHQRGKLRPISADEVYPGPSCYPESSAFAITPSGQMYCDYLLSPSRICMLHVCSLAHVQERERTPSCNVGINIHGASGACRGYGAGVEIRQSGCVSRQREVCSGCTRKRSPRIPHWQRSPVTLWCHRHTSLFL